MARVVLRRLLMFVWRRAGPDGELRGVWIRELYDNLATRAEVICNAGAWASEGSARVVDGIVEVGVELSDASVRTASSVELGQALFLRLREKRMAVRLVTARGWGLGSFLAGGIRSKPDGSARFAKDEAATRAVSRLARV